ncbi:MAG: formate/nitrite transporter family protein [Ruminococcaceae bacterium]|nr:formate/nitrite transporter family protein [Oscillospiraceae bacterium]
MKTFQTFISAFLGGIAIALGCAASLVLNTESVLVGAVFFSAGFLAIGVFELSIFTDNLGAIFKKGNAAKHANKLLIIYLGNIFGSLLTGIALIPKLQPIAKAFLMAKFEESFESICLSSILCGILIYIAMHGFRKAGSGFTGCAVLVVASAIIPLCGFDYAIANVFYVGAAFNNIQLYGTKIGEILLLVIFVALGNLIGTLIFSALNQFKNEDLTSSKRSHRHKHRHSHRHHHHEDDSQNDEQSSSEEENIAENISDEQF